MRATMGLISFLNKEFISKPCYDLWEERNESHLYSTASIYEALKVSRKLLAKKEECEFLICEIDLLLPEIAKGIQRNFVENHRLKRSLQDNIPDISNLAVHVPFEVVGISKEVIENTVLEIEEHLKLPNGGYLRYETDDYIGGNAWIISSLWLALYYCKIGKKEKAKELYDWVTCHADDKGFLPEQIDRENGKTAWVTQLSWSHALYIIVGKKLKE